MKDLSQLANAATTAAVKAALEYLRTHNLTADDSVLAECVKLNCSLRLPEALADAKEAVACNMGQMAVTTFCATMALAGIDAAKECGRPAWQPNTPEQSARSAARDRASLETNSTWTL